MRFDRIFLSSLLIPALIAGPNDQLSEPARKLLRKPRLGNARVAWVDGTQSNGYILRITNQSVAFLHSGACESVDLARIAKVRSLPDRDRTFEAIMMVLAAPLYLIYPLPGGALVEGLRYVFSARMLGEWESATGQEVVLQDDAYMRHYVERREVVDKSGQYRIEGAMLYVTYEGSGAVEVIPIRFACDKLIAGAAASLTLAAEPGHQPRPAADPIVGQWLESHRLGATTWDFKPGGAFHMRTESRVVGEFAKTKQGLQVDWMDGSAVELWDVRVKDDRLFITVGGSTVEYRRRLIH
jgi:hypothetical protein